MKNEIVMKSAPPILADLWLWLSNHELTWFVSGLTILYIVSQLIWGWTKYFKRGDDGKL